jgi:cell division septation protein DedD
MFNFVFDRKSFALLITGLTLAGGLLFFAGLLVGVNFGLPTGSQVVYTPPVLAKDPCPEPQPAAPVRPAPEPPPQVVRQEPPPPVEEEPPPVQTASLSQPEPEPAETGPYSVQIGAFRSKENSDAVVRDLESRGYDPFVVPLTTRRRSVLHTVRIGRYTTREEALQAASDLREREKLDTIIQRSREL